MALGSCQFGFLKEPKDSHGESLIMQTLAKVSSFRSPRQACPWQTAPAAPSYGFYVFSAGPWGWHGEGGVWSSPYIPGGPWRHLEEREYVPKVAVWPGTMGLGKWGKPDSFSG